VDGKAIGVNCLLNAWMWCVKAVRNVTGGQASVSAGMLVPGCFHGCVTMLRYLAAVTTTHSKCVPNRVVFVEVLHGCFAL